MISAKFDASSPMRWDFLDGIRGLAALYVVFDHAITPLPRQGVSSTTSRIIEMFAFGKIAVAIFIVLSGIVLALPYTKNKDKWDLKTFLFRRARRLLPPFYASVLISIPLSIIYDKSHGSNISLNQILAHLFLLQHFNMPLSGNGWLFSANWPLWSVSVEWEIYLIYGFFLFQIWKRFGILTSTITGISLSLLPLLFLSNYNWYYPSYLGLFSIGVALANSSTNTKFETPTPTKTLIFNLIALSILILTILIYAQNSLYININIIKLKFPLISIIHDYLIAMFMTSLTISLIFDMHSEKKSLLYRCLNHKTSLFLGKISYSMYLIHYPILASTGFILKNKTSGDLLIISQISIGVPLVLFITVIFHNLVEKPFLNKKTGT